MSDVAASADLSGPSPDPMITQPTPPTLVIGAGSSHNSGIAQEWMPDLKTTEVGATSVVQQVVGIVAGYQQQAGQFISEYGGAVLDGHSPVGMSASDIAGPSDLGSPGSAGTADNAAPPGTIY